MKYDFTVNFDGACEPTNPGGNMGMGCLVKNASGEVVFSGSEFIAAGPKNTNNVAEYKALLLALNYFIKNGLCKSSILIRGDSMLVINQMSGEWRARAGLYYNDYLTAKSLVQGFPNTRFEWVRRELNQEADDLSKAKVQ